MRLKQYLTEKYFKRVKGRYGTSFEVFVNPTKKELMEVGGGEYGIRFIADDEYKKLYVWNALKLIHQEAWEAMGFKGHIAYRDDYMLGQARHIGSGKWLVKSNYEKRMQKQTDYDRFEKFKWVQKYIDIKGYFDKI